MVITIVRCQNVYPHGNLEEEVYIDFPLGFEDSMQGGKVCKLKKS